MHMQNIHYWMYSPGEQANRWGDFTAAGVLALDYDGIGDLNSYVSEDSLRLARQEAVGTAVEPINDVRAMMDFRDVMKPGDLVFAKKGLNTVVGVGRVTSEYFYVENVPDMRHRRKVEWFVIGERHINERAPLKTLTDITSYSRFLIKLADLYNLEDLYAESLHRLWDEFLQKWPIENIRSMTLSDYNKIQSKDSFCYWLEKILEDMGSVWGGSSYKFGIYEYNKNNPKPLDKGASGDDQYRWYTKYGTTATAAFAVVKARVIAIAEAALRGAYDEIEGIDFSPIIKWKIAFLYQAKDKPGVIDIYKKDMLMKAVGEENSQLPMSKLYANAMKKVPEGMDNFVWARRQWLQLNEGKGDNQMENSSEGSFNMEAVTEFCTAIESAGLKYEATFIYRFLAALCAKPFVVLTGLSGSGKTKLAQAFASWMSLGVSARTTATKCFTSGLVIPGARSSQAVLEVGDQGLIVAQGNGKCTCLSYEIINEWIETIKKHGYTKDTGSGTIKDQVISEHPKYSPYLHAFDPVLKALAFYQIEHDKAKSSADAIVENTLLVPVGADWTNNEHLLGYPDALQSGQYVMPDTGVLKMMLDARDNPQLPFFLILDEMNLSHVERYFADILSAMESGDEIKLYDGENRFAEGIKIPRTIKFPQNLFVIGTMNVDETTYMFSPKVLDRAQVIEFRIKPDEMGAYLANPSSPNLAAIENKGAKYAEAFLKLKDVPPALDAAGSTMNKDAIAAALNKFFPELAKLGAEFGYRSASEIVRFCAYYLATGATIDDAIDAAIVQKLLPKLHGSQARLGPVLRKLKELATKETVTSEGGETKKVRTPLYTLTCEKLDRMLDRLKANGFTSFAEA